MKPRTLTLAQIREGAKRASAQFERWPSWKKELSGSKSTELQCAGMNKILNAFYDFGKVKFVFRDEHGRRQYLERSASPRCYLEVDTETATQLRIELQPKEVAAKDGWYRFTWRNRADAHEKTKKLHEMGHQTYDGDLSPIRRHVALEQFEIARPRRVYLDIETDSRVRIGNAANGGARVLSWCLVNEAGEALVGCLESDSDGDEKRLLGELWDALDQYDQVLAWNGDYFDFPVIRLRSERLGLKINWRQWLWLDHMLLFKRMNTAKSGDEKTSYSLQAIAMALLDHGKDDFDAAYTYEAWAAGGVKRKEMLEYMQKDTTLLREIEEKTGYIELLQTLCEVTGTFPDSHGMKPGGQVETYLMRLAVKRGMRFPTQIERLAPRDREERIKFRGAYVMNPASVGVAKNVHVADFASLYPSIIRTWNMSPETKGDGPNVCESAIGVHFRTDVEGILPAALREMMSLRTQWKAEMKKHPVNTPAWTDAFRKSTAYKIAANSFYGVIGSPSTRFFDLEVAESVTQSGVWLIKRTIEEAQARGLSVVYGDSVTGDRVLVVRDPHENVRMMPAEELWENETNCIDYGDPKEVGTLLGWKALARDSDGNDGWFPIECMKRHRVDKATYLISTKHGQTHVTEDHGIMCGGVETRPADMIEQGLKFDTVSAPREEPFEEIDLFEYIKNFEHSFPYKGRKVVRRFVANGDEIWLAGWGKVRLKIKRFYHRGSPELAALLRLIFAYVSDGSSVLRVPSARYMLSLCKSNELLQKQLKQDLETIIDGVNVFGPYATANTIVVRSGTATAACLFAALCGKGFAHKQLPPFVFKLSDHDFRIALKGLCDGDGHIDEVGQLAFASKSQKLISGVSYLLSQRGIEHAHNYRPSNQSWSIRTRPPGTERNRCKLKHEKTESYGDYVYDLTVEGAHTFVDGVGRVLLHNTDSLFVKGATEEEFSKFVQWCNAELYPKILSARGCVDNQIKLGYEKEFSRLVFVSAKRYAGAFVHYEGVRADATSKPETKGLEYKRGDTLRLARQMQEEIVHRVLGYQCTPVDSPEELAQLIEQWKDRITRGPLDLDDVAFSKGLGRPISEYKTRIKKDGTRTLRPPHVEVAAELIARGRDIREGTKVKYICTNGFSNPKQYAAAEDAYDCDGELRVDRWALWENYIWAPSKRFAQSAFPDYYWDRFDTEQLSFDW